MMNNNKILTVSYGTFSCTLEGFDDSFETMKAIAEYFRDLAADDRYFGAEPPQPDAELLARIAEREVSRRVEAREHEGRIMLKAHEEPVAATAAAQMAEMHDVTKAEAPVKTPLTSGAAASENLEEVESEQEETLAEHVPAETAVADEEVAETVAEDSEEDAGVSSEEEQSTVAREAETEEDQDSIAETSETDGVEAGERELGEEVNQAENMVSAEETVALVQDDDIADEMDAAAFFAQQPTEAVADEDDFEFATAEDLDAEDVMPAKVFGGASLADKLERIRAVVSSQDAQSEEAAYEEDIEEPAEMHRFDDIETFEAAADDHETETASESEEVIAQATQDISNAFEIDDASEATAEDDTAGEQEDLDAVLRRLTDTAAEETLEAPFDLADEAQDEEISEDDSADNLFSPEASVDDDADEQEPQSRIMKVDREDLQTALASGELEEFEDDDLAAAARLSADAEAELQRDLAALEEEAIDNSHAGKTPHAAREKLPDIGSDAGEDVSRLMAEADHQMQEPEGKTRRSAFAHLRAAVAARFADRTMEDAEKRVEEAAEAYRNDLAEAVKPRRPAMPARSETREEARPAPLKLVAEQRIHEQQQPVSRGPVAPRRIEASDIDGAGDAEDSGFALYAEERGAESLPELLEAAAAYLSFIEGHEQFSRPQLMSRVRQAHSEEFSREDGLRSFGQLLRTGKIEKIRGGRFTASEAIGFKPDHRAAG